MGGSGFSQVLEETALPVFVLPLPSAQIQPLLMPPGKLLQASA